VRPGGGLRSRAWVAPALLALLLFPGPGGAGAAGSGRRADDPKPARRIDPPPFPAGPGVLAPAERVELRDGRDLFLAVRVGPLDTYASMGQTYLTQLRDLAAVKDLNGASLPAAGSTLLIPYAALNDDYKVKVIRDLFPRDGPRDGDWVHVAGSGRVAAAEESLWQISLWLTGRGENFEALADRNELPGLSPRRGQEVVIPGEILLAPFARLAGSAAAATPPPPPGGPGPPAAEAADEAQEAEDDFTEAPGETEAEPSPQYPGLPPAEVPMAEGADQLTYGADKDGRYAGYRLKRGEALYSAVVVRYTGRVDAQDVNELALKIARRSGIADVTDISIGFRIKIPLDEILPEYLPRDDPRRQAWERSQAGVARYTNRVRSLNLKGIAVILDAGHGGRDQGASHNGVWEHDYVYDVLCRIKAKLENETGARVLSTIKDRSEGYAIHETTRLPMSRAEALLTDPPFPLQQRAASVNLRWYLSNAYYRHLQTEGFDPLRIVFTSLHADARHPSLGGAMVYVPAEEYRRGRYGHRGAVYARHREVREQPYVSFTRSERERSEGLSRQFAASLIAAFRQRGVSVHPYGPVRERIIRRGRSWVPAVLRCNEVPVEALIEISNLNNPADSRLLADPRYRQKVAEAYVDALHLYYGGPTRPPGRIVSSGGH
jgi:N-acetylmuramoyl-L-alanine amidase